MKTEQLSENFSFMEFIKTSHKDHFKSNLHCARHPAVLRNLKSLAKDILQPIRYHFDKPLIITSGFRYPELNRKVGGSNNSQHLYGEAADFYIKDTDKNEVFIWITCSSSLIYGQCILEPSWIHISFPRMYKKYNHNLIAELDSNGNITYKKV